MSKSSLLPILAITCLAACGSDAADPATGATDGAERRAGLVPTPTPSEATSEADEDAPMTIESLVPAGTVAWVRVSSFDELSALLDELLAASEIGMDFESVLQLLPVKDVFENLDRERALGLAIGMDENTGEPTVTLMLPALDRGAVIQGLRTLPEPPQCFGIDDYVVATTLDEYRPGLGSAGLTEDLPSAQLAARLDVATLTEHLGPIFETGLGQVANNSPSALRGAADRLSEVLATASESAESLDLALSFEEGELDVSIALVATSGSALDGLLPKGSSSLYDLAHCADGEDELALLVTVDSNTLQDELLPFYEEALDSAQVTAEEGEQALAMLREWGALMPLFGDSVVASVRNGDNGAELAWYCRPTDRQMLVDGLSVALGSLDRNFDELSVSGPETQGALSHSWALDFDSDSAGGELAEAFPGGRAALRVGERRDVTVITLGGDERTMSRALERIARPDGEVDASLGSALDHIGDANPAFVARIDLAGMAERAGLASTGTSGPVHLVYYGGVDGRVWKLGFRADVSELASLAR